MAATEPLRRPLEGGVGPDLTHAEFGRLVREALGHLYDPVYLQTHPLARLLPATPGARATGLGKALRQSLLDAIEALRPEPTAGSPGSPSPSRTSCSTVRVG